jgi:NCS2 family nucleobase:cation symporter-2
MSEITQQPAVATPPVYILDPHANRTKEEDIDLSHTVGKFPTWTTIQESLGTRTGWFGDYDYGFLCMPTLPGLTKVTRIPPFFGLKDRLPLVLAIVMGMFLHVTPFRFLLFLE